MVEPMEDVDMVKELWDLANTITAFGVIQNLGFALALANDLSWITKLTARHRFALIRLTIVFAFGYALANIQICRLALQLDPKHHAVWNQVTIGRVFAVILFSGLVVFGLHSCSPKKHNVGDAEE